MKYFIFFSVLTLQHQLTTPQMLRPPPFNLINRQIGERIIETGNFINPPPSPTVISEPPCNSLVPMPNVGVAPPSTTLITDCSPAICQNLANTIQLMIVCNLLQNSKGSDLALQLAGPILNEVLSGPAIPCGCTNTISPSVVSPNVITPNFIPNLSPNVISPNLYGPNIISPNFVNPNIVSPIAPSVISPSIVPFPPRVVAPTGCPNNVISNPANVNGLLNSIMSILGNMKS